VPDRPLKISHLPPAGAACHSAHVDTKALSEIKDVDDIVPPQSIPATGRGNSEDGKTWLNPSANQLYRALKRKEKPIDKENAWSVAQVHVAVTDNTWKEIMEYEALHRDQCANAKLDRFSGQDGNYSLKARFFHFFLGRDYPFDRHDWIVNRCGKEVRYVIDYHSHETPTEVEYFIDARPALTLSGLYDRVRIAFRRGVSSSSRITIHRVFSSLPTISSFFFGTSSWTTRKR